MPIKIWALYLGVVAASLFLTACDEAEQDRVLRYEKGVYLGSPDAALNEEQVDDLRHRATLQGGS